MNRVVLVKLGGSLITDKSKALTPRPATIRRLGKEMKEARLLDKKLIVILAHGSGSFGHIPASKYGTARGFVSDRGRLGACVTHDIAAQINRIVIKELLSAGLPVASLSPSSIFVSNDGKINTGFFDSLQAMVGKAIIPVLYGDVIWDSARGSSIFSGEKSLGLVAKYLLSLGWKIDREIQCGSEEGVLEYGKIIPLITPANFPSIKKFLSGSEQTDVTGGMLHKVNEALELASHGVETIIISGKIGRLKHSLLGRQTIGTYIRNND